MNLIIQGCCPTCQPRGGTATVLAMREPHIIIAGAGSIGCFVGGLLAAGGREASLLLRESVGGELRRNGLHLADLGGMAVNLTPDRLALTSNPAVLSNADIILVTVKSGATRVMGEEIARHARPDSVVVSLQNGVNNAAALGKELPGRTVIAGMVPFNVVRLGAGRFHRGTSGALVIEAGQPEVVEALRVPGLAVDEASDMEAVLWGKLLLNLNNALNALSGLTLHQQLLDRGWRRILAAQQHEALELLAAAGIKPWSMGPLPARALPSVLRLPTPLFRLLARSSVRIDRQARSSMWEDLERNRPTEIDELQGAVIALADRLGRAAPINARVRALVGRAERSGQGSPRLSPEDLGL
jgi:2-dehydropantoate 2-reductase